MCKDFTTRFARDTEAQRIQMWGFLKEFVEREEFLKPLLFLPVLLQKTVAGFLILVLRNYKCRNILFCGVLFSVPQCL